MSLALHIEEDIHPLFRRRRHTAHHHWQYRAYDNVYSSIPCQLQSAITTMMTGRAMVVRKTLFTIFSKQIEARSKVMHRITWNC